MAVHPAFRTAIEPVAELEGSPAPSELEGSAPPSPREAYDAESVYSQDSDPGSPVTDAGSERSTVDLPQTPTRSAAWPEEADKKRNSTSSSEGQHVHHHWWQRRRERASVV